MNSLTVTFTALFLFFTFSSARLPFNLPENDVIDRDASSSLVESNSKSTIFLPSEKSESDPTTIIDVEPVELTNQETRTTNNEPGGSADDLPVLSNTISVETLDLKPSNYVRIRPINRHFHRCRHHHMNRGLQGRQVPYGNDMILAGENSDHLDPPMFRAGKKQIPSRWGRIHHHHHNDDAMMMMMYPFRQYMFAKQKFKSEEEQREEMKEREREVGGFMKSIRKFLNNF